MLCDFCVIFRAVLDFLKRVVNFDAMYQCLKKMQFHVAHAGLGAVKFCFFRQVCSVRMADISPCSWPLKDVSQGERPSSVMSKEKHLPFAG